jgi:hypothetical protein
MPMVFLLVIFKKITNSFMKVISFLKVFEIIEINVSLWAIS